jgi:hypothetical protein
MVTRVNPLYLLLLAVTLIGVMGYRVHLAQLEQRQLSQSLQETRAMGVKIRQLKTVWFDGDQTRKRLDGLLKSAPLRSEAITMTRHRSHITLTAARIGAQKLDHLTGKLLNGTYEVRKMNIRRLDDTHASITVEVAQ